MRLAALLLLSLPPLLLGAQCRTVETRSLPFETQLWTEPADVPVRVSTVLAGQVASVLRQPDGSFRLKIPPMDGGYSEVLFVFRYNVHDPRNYRVVRVSGAAGLRDFSTSQLLALPEDSRGGRKLVVKP